VTTSAQRAGFSLTETARVVHGAFRQDGEYSPLTRGSSQRALDLTAIVAGRPAPPLEIAVESSVGREALAVPGYAGSRTGFGDTFVRARFEASDEPMPFEDTRLPWPSVAIIAAVRLPTAAGGELAGRSTTAGSVGGSGSSVGLGATEASLAVALARSAGVSWSFSLVGEGAYRFRDDTLGRERHLGPRALVQGGARYSFSPEVGVGGLVDLGWEGDVAYAGVTRAETAQRSVALSAYGYLRARYSPLRWGLLVRHVPALDGLAVNALSTTSLAVSLGYSI
jgi:hypothetical protein